MYKQGAVKQERFYEENLNMDKVKEELKEDIQWESKRVNVDSSKKRAVLQRKFSLYCLYL
jgi:hypothetical protein